MTLVEFIGLITNSVTALTALIAIFLVLRQMHKMDETLQSQVYQGLIDNSLKIDMLLIENPKFRKYIYGNEILTDKTPDLDQIMSVMEFMVDVVDNVEAQEKIIPKAERPGWRKFSEEVLSSPAAQYFLHKHGSWFSGGIPQIINGKNKLSLIQRIKKLIGNTVNSKGKISIKSYVSSKVVVCKSRIDGSGMFAKVRIKKGEIVFIKGGHLLTRDELFSSKKINSYLPIDDNYFLGARNKDEEDGIKLFINHSCEPNCGLRGEITFVAMREIKKGEELTCDYAMIDNDDYQFKCKCGSVCCRKNITGFDWKRKDIQSKYLDYFARYHIDKINPKI